MIIIDDGSTDNCRDVVNSYKKRFKEKGYELEYHYQNNQGQSYAVKHGLQYAKGEFLSWPDSDDFYSTHKALSLLSGALKNSGSDFRLVRGKAVFVDEHSLQPLYSASSVDKTLKTEDFEDCLFARNGFYFPPIAYMTYTETILNLTKREIFCSKNAGQNWQLMLPVLWHYRLKNIPEHVCNILERSSSHSRGQFKGSKGEITKNEVYEKTLLETIEKIPGLSLDQQNKYKNLITKKYYTLATIINYTDRNRKDFKKLYFSWDSKSWGKKPMKFRLKYYSSILHIEYLVEFIFRHI